MHGNQLPEVTISPVAIEIGTKAWQALLEEVYTTPKPGLVDTWFMRCTYRYGCTYI